MKMEEEQKKNDLTELNKGGIQFSSKSANKPIMKKDEDSKIIINLLVNAKEFSKIIGKKGLTLSFIRSSTGISIQGVDITADSKMVTMFSSKPLQLCTAFDIILEVLHDHHVRLSQTNHIVTPATIEAQIKSPISVNDTPESDTIHKNIDKKENDGNKGEVDNNPNHETTDSTNSKSETTIAGRDSINQKTTNTTITGIIVDPTAYADIEMEITILMEHGKVGKVIGSQGTNLLLTKQQSGIKSIKVEKEAEDFGGVYYRRVVIVGGIHMIRRAFSLIVEQLSTCSDSITYHYTQNNSVLNSEFVYNDTVYYPPPLNYPQSQSQQTISAEQGNVSLTPLQQQVNERLQYSGSVESDPLSVADSSIGTPVSRVLSSGENIANTAAITAAKNDIVYTLDTNTKNDNGVVKIDTATDATTLLGESVSFPTLTEHGLLPETVEQLINMQTYLKQYFGLNLLIIKDTTQKLKTNDPITQSKSSSENPDARAHSSLEVESVPPSSSTDPSQPQQEVKPVSKPLTATAAEWVPSKPVDKVVPTQLKVLKVDSSSVNSECVTQSNITTDKANKPKVKPNNHTSTTNNKGENSIDSGKTSKNSGNNGSKTSNNKASKPHSSSLTAPPIAPQRTGTPLPDAVNAASASFTQPLPSPSLVFYIPTHTAGGVIGKRSHMLLHLQETYGVRIYIEKETIVGIREVNISHATPPVAASNKREDSSGNNNSGIASKEIKSKMKPLKKCTDMNKISSSGTGSGGDSSDCSSNKKMNSLSNSNIIDSIVVSDTLQNVIDFVNTVHTVNNNSGGDSSNSVNNSSEYLVPTSSVACSTAVDTDIVPAPVQSPPPGIVDFVDKNSPIVTAESNILKMIQSPPPGLVKSSSNSNTPRSCSKSDHTSSITNINIVSDNNIINNNNNNTNSNDDCDISTMNNIVCGINNSVTSSGVKCPLTACKAAIQLLVHEILLEQKQKRESVTATTSTSTAASVPPSSIFTEHSTERKDV